MISNLKLMLIVLAIIISLIVIIVPIVVLIKNHKTQAKPKSWSDAQIINYMNNDKDFKNNCKNTDSFIACFMRKLTPSDKNSIIDGDSFDKILKNYQDCISSCDSPIPPPIPPPNPPIPPNPDTCDPKYMCGNECCVGNDKLCVHNACISVDDLKCEGNHGTGYSVLQNKMICCDKNNMIDITLCADSPNEHDCFNLSRCCDYEKCLGECCGKDEGCYQGACQKLTGYNYDYNTKTCVRSFDTNPVYKTGQDCLDADKGCSSDKDCSEHGTCNAIHECQCDVGFTGKDCSQLGGKECLNDRGCSLHGKYIYGKCVCDTGYSGIHCEISS